MFFFLIFNRTDHKRDNKNVLLTLESRINIGPGKFVKRINVSKSETPLLKGLYQIFYFAVA
jgi:hypothetical protein